MIDLNTELQEKYKMLDRLCCEKYGIKQGGVTAYINDMESRNGRGVEDWDYDYRMLKHIRHVRNSLAHDIGTSYIDQCTEDELDWLDDFYNRVLCAQDPIATLAKKWIEARKKVEKPAVKDSIDINCEFESSDQNKRKHIGLYIFGGIIITVATLLLIWAFGKEYLLLFL